MQSGHHSATLTMNYEKSGDGSILYYFGAGGKTCPREEHDMGQQDWVVHRRLYYRVFSDQ